MFLKNRWISCNDKMPDKDKNVLITDGKHMRIAKLMRDNDGKFTTIGVFTHNYSFGVPTHWMLLPRLPK